MIELIELKKPISLAAVEKVMRWRARNGFTGSTLTRVHCGAISIRSTKFSSLPAPSTGNV